MPLTENKAPDWTASEEREKVVCFIERKMKGLREAKQVLPGEYRTICAQLDAAHYELTALVAQLSGGMHSDD